MLDDTSTQKQGILRANKTVECPDYASCIDKIKLKEYLPPSKNDDSEVCPKNTLPLLPKYTCQCTSRQVVADRLCI